MSLLPLKWFVVIKSTMKGSNVEAFSEGTDYSDAIRNFREQSGYSGKAPLSAALYEDIPPDGKIPVYHSNRA